MPFRHFSLDAAFTAALDADGLAGIGMMGCTWYYAALGNGAVRLVRGTADSPEQELLSVPYKNTELMLRMQVRDGFVSFLFGSGPDDLQPLGSAFPMAAGGWTGARPGIFCISKSRNPAGYADFRSVRILRCQE